MIVELVGLPGAGKTTIRGLVSVPHGVKGSVPLSGLRPTPELLRAAWHIAVLCASTRPFAFGRLKRGFNLTVFLRHYQDHGQTILLDQGMVQKLWSILIDARSYPRSRLDHVMRALRPFAPDHIVWIVTPPDISAGRITGRRHGNSRMDGLPLDQSVPQLTVTAEVLDMLVNEYQTQTGTPVTKLQGEVPPTLNAARINGLFGHGGNKTQVSTRGLTLYIDFTFLLNKRTIIRFAHLAISGAFVKTLRKTFRRYKRQVISSLSQKVQEQAKVSAKDRTAAIELGIVGTTSRDWAMTNRGSRITFVRSKLLSPGGRVFTMGSCFAVEIRKALLSRGYDTYPKYSDIPFDLKSQRLANLPERDNVNHYNTFVIRQEFEMAFGKGRYGLRDFIEAPTTRHLTETGQALSWKDPYRKGLLASSSQSIEELSNKVSDCIRHAIEAADVYIITLGLTEVWKNNVNGLYLNQSPRDADDRFSFVESTYEQNYENIHRVAAMLAEHYPEKKVVFTVSPVPLAKTFTKNDIVVANTESKSILRAVAAQVSKQMPNVVYWPSYEIALARDLFENDGRHVRVEGIDIIVDQFLKVHT